MPKRIRKPPKYTLASIRRSLKEHGSLFFNYDHCKEHGRTFPCKHVNYGPGGVYLISEDRSRFGWSFRVPRYVIWKYESPNNVSRVLTQKEGVKLQEAKAYAKTLAKHGDPYVCPECKDNG